MEQGETSSNWTELYFRFLQLISFNGRTIAFASFFGLIILTLSVKFFLNSSFHKLKNKDVIFRFLCLFPLMPLFGLTVQHDVFACSGTLLLTGISLRITRSNYPFDRDNTLLVVLAVFFSSMSYIGIIGVIGFLFVLLIKNNKIFMAITVLALIALQLLSLILAVAPKDPGFKLIPFLGDLKCIAQDEDSIITDEQWNFLEKLGPRNQWINLQTCMSADNAMFAVESAGQTNIVEFVRNWSSIVSQNSRVFLSARVQRASMALPPPFFSGQPNSRESNYLIAVGQNSNRSLRNAPEVIIDSPLEGKFKKQQIPVIKYLERPVLSAAFLVNQNSKLWGWGGFWIIWFVLFIVIFEKRNLLGVVPALSQLLLLILLSPMPDPRYVFSWILMGMSSAIYLIIMFIQKANLGAINEH